MSARRSKRVRKTSESVEPGVRAFDHPTILSESAAMFGPALRNHRLDTAISQGLPMSLGVVAAISVDHAETVESDGRAGRESMELRRSTAATE